MLVQVISAVISVAGLGVLMGVGLAVAAKFLAVQKDECIAIIEAELPGLNCGACGYAGCASYAEIIAGKEEENLTLCTPGGPDVVLKISEIMGVEVAAMAEKQVTQVHCTGGKGKAEYEFAYSGIRDCNALYALYGGDKKCKHGCLGQGSCIRVCPVNAISYTENGLLWINKEFCIACGKCIEVCPTGVIRWLPYNSDYLVACNSTDKGGAVRKICKVGCTGCKICEKKSPDGGFKVEDFLSRIDYQAEGERESGAVACPTKCIIRNDVEIKKK